MTGIEKIIAKINADAEAEYSRIVAEAEAAAEAKASAAAEEARAAAAEIVAAAEEERGEIERRAVGMAGLEVRKTRLALKQKLILRAFAGALTKLTSMPEGQYRAYLIAQAKKSDETGAEIILNSADRAKYGEGILAALKADSIYAALSPETRDIHGGVIVRMGKVEVNSSIDAVLADRREELTAQAAKILF
jgi:V/A-type H+-transporting ATPase subunit E